jgi:Cu+-exporting ATPase
MANKQNISKPVVNCYHCGDLCTTQNVSVGEKYFCCHGCKSVYELLNENELCDYYALNKFPGQVQKRESRKDKYDFLENVEIQHKLIDFQSDGQTHITFYLPQIHCSSCLWLLENLYKIMPGIISSRVNFTKKEVFIAFNSKDISLRQLVETLANIGYEPYLSLNDLSSNARPKTDRSRWYKIGLAGFCFGNIMMMSLAEYLDFSKLIEPKISIFFKVFSLLLSIPVLFYAASEFFVSAWNGLKNKYINIDLPVSIALVITFLRSIYEISNGISNGYLDSLSGIVFFMLIGRWLQSRTYQTIAFDRDYKSFFPIALNVIKDNIIIPVEISDIKEGDIIQIHSNEIIPVDAILSKGKAKIDYSFVSGESLPIALNVGELVYAGGRQIGGILELLVVKEVSQSYLTNLWNNPVFSKDKGIKESNFDIIGKYFTYFVLFVGFLAGFYWYLNGKEQLMWNAITSVLIVACPCALLLSTNFTYGNIVRIFGLNKFYLKSPEIIESLSKIKHIVFDKTGTLTQNSDSDVRYIGTVLSAERRHQLASLLQHSAHPASKMVLSYLNEKGLSFVNHFKEIEGNGIEGWIDECHIKLGSPSFVGGSFDENKSGTKVVVSIDGTIMGDFVISNKYRNGMDKLIHKLKQQFSVSLISGDNANELINIEKLFGKGSAVFFNQSPEEKLQYIQKLQMNNEIVMMVGDGLNDAGALKQSDIGIVVSDTNNNFTPASDGVIDATKLNNLVDFIRFATIGRKIIIFSFLISVVYNLIGLKYAMQGVLSPMIAAILMPLSSITIIFITYGMSEFFAKKCKLK